MRREADLEKAFVKHIVRTGGEVRKVKWIGRNGAPDRLVLYPHKQLFWVELKWKDGPLRPEQGREHERLRAMGQIVYVIRSKEDYEVLYFPVAKKQIARI